MTTQEDAQADAPQHPCGHHPYCACYLPASTAFVDYSIVEPDLPDIPDWAKALGASSLGVPHVFMLEKPAYSPDPGYPFWLHWHDAPNETPRWVVGGLPLHDVISRHPWHLEASILCDPDGCGLHGFIRDDEWRDA